MLLPLIEPINTHSLGNRTASMYRGAPGVRFGQSDALVVPEQPQPWIRTKVSTLARESIEDSQLQKTGLQVEAVKSALIMELRAERMKLAATNELNESVAEAAEENELLPSELALFEAKAQIDLFARYLTMLQPKANCPVMSAYVTEKGAIRIIGFFEGIVGRHTIDISQDGDSRVITSTTFKEL